MAHFMQNHQALLEMAGGVMSSKESVDKSGKADYTEAISYLIMPSVRRRRGAFADEPHHLIVRAGLRRGISPLPILKVRSHVLLGMVHSDLGMHEGGRP
jgi:hypothetical protein